jgi:hypothetical protein
VADYGLDPSVINYVQGNGMPVMPQQPPMDAPQPPYGLDPSVVTGVQNGFAPQQSIAMPQQSPMPPPQQFGVSPEVVGAPGSPQIADTQVPSVTAGALPPPVQMPAPQVEGLPVQNTPDRVIGTADALTPKQLAANNKMYDARQAQQSAFESSPEGIAQKADAQKLAVIEQERQAQVDQQAAETVKNDAIAKATADSAARQAEQAKAAEAQRAADQQTVDGYVRDSAQKIDDAAKYKVNTNRDVGLSGLIAVALSGIGDAIAHQHGPNAALEIINKRIDANIADQWAQKKALGDQANDSTKLVDAARQTSADHRQEQDFQKATALTAASNEIANATAAAANPLQKARGEQLQAAIGQQRAGLIDAIAQRKLEAQKVAAAQRVQQQQLGVQYGELGLKRDAFNEQKRTGERDFALKVAEYNAQGNEQAAAQTAKTAQKLKEEGVYDPNTGNVLLDAAATPVLAKAKQLDAQAAASTDPAQQAALAKQAQDLRTDAKLQYGATLDDKDGKLKEKLGGAQRLINTTQRIRDALDDGSITDRDTRAALKTEATNAFAAWAETNGVKASSREHEVYTEAMGAIDGLASTNTNKGPLKASLDALDRGTQNLAGTILRGHGIKAVDGNGNPWVLTAEKPAAAATTPGTTSAERGANAEPGAVTKLLGVDLRHPFTSPEERNPINVENSGDFTMTGLGKQDDSKVLGLIKTYGRTSPEENQRVVSSLVNLVGDPGDDERKQAIANSVISRVRGESPILYQKVLDALPDARRKEITRFDVQLHPSIVKGMGWSK